MTRRMRLDLCLWAALALACGSGGPSADGTDGTDGKNGTNGADGKSSLIRFVPESPGAHCPNGGTAVQSGLDKNSNGALEDGEVTSTAYTCNGSAGQSSAQPLVRMDPEPAGTHCPQGGTLVSIGLDANGNRTLEQEEVTSTSFVCNGATGSAGTPGTPGAQALVRLDTEPAGVNCPMGGTAVRSGLDANGNGTLDTAEVTQTQYLCTSAAAYATGWAASPPVNNTGEVPVGFWVPAGRKVSIFKTSASSQLKLTVSDALRTGYGVNGGYGYYMLRMNGGYMSPHCYQGQYSWNASGWINDYHFPFATVCITDPLPAGLYEFEAWAYSGAGTSYVGGTGNIPLLFVEELLPTARYGLSTAGGTFSTTSTAYQQVPNRTVTYTKQSADTLLKVTLADTLRGGYNQNGSLATVMVRMDGANTSCYLGKYDEQGTGGNFHDPFVMTCVFPNVSAGAHTFTVWLKSDTGGDAYLTYERGYPLLMVEEISGQNMTYSNGSSPSGEISGNWAGVGGRQIQHVVSAPGKTLRVTYSDTFRSTVGCNGRWGFFQLYVNGQPTGCGNSQYAYNTGANQNHHHPVNLVCLVKNPTPGSHTFAIWSSTRHADGTTCGSNHFGYARGQNLLMVEELP